MGLQDKIKNKIEDVTGKGKEAVGDATDDKSMEARARPIRPRAA